MEGNEKSWLWKNGVEVARTTWQGPILSDLKLAHDELIAQLQKYSSAPLYVYICQKLSG
jgi:hypothetical protein